MRISRPALLFFLCSLIPASLSAQQSASTSVPAPASDPQAVALVQRALSALIGSASISDVTLTGTARRIAGSDDETGTATLTATAAGDSKLSLNFPSGPRTEIRNHSAIPLPGSLPPSVPASVAQTAQPVGAWSGPDSAIHGMANHNVMTDAAWFFPALTLARMADAPNMVLSYVGQETLNGQAVVHISASQQLSAPSNLHAQLSTLPQHLSQMDLYLDPTTLLPVALAFNTHPDSNALVDIATQVQFSGYRAVNGVQVPLHVQKYLNNGLVLDLQLNTTALNSGLTAATFQIQ